MATGLALPVGIDSKGRARMVSGVEQTDKIILLHLADGESDNPYQDIGIGEEVVFANPETRARAIVTDRIRTLFRRLEKSRRAKLASSSISIQSLPGTGNFDVGFERISLESDRPGVVKRRLSQEVGADTFPQTG
jgi:hypothetical protein